MTSIWNAFLEENIKKGWDLRSSTENAPQELPPAVQEAQEQVAAVVEGKTAAAPTAQAEAAAAAKTKKPRATKPPKADDEPKDASAPKTTKKAKAKKE